jgi:aminopeptidase N
VEFEKTPRMSTYLVALIISPNLDFISSKSTNGLPIGIWTPKHMRSQALYASQVTPRIIDFFENYFGKKYVLPKLDLIAIPDFSAGAMVNDS